MKKEVTDCLKVRLSRDINAQQTRSRFKFTIPYPSLGFRSINEAPNLNLNHDATAMEEGEAGGGEDSSSRTT